MDFSSAVVQPEAPYRFAVSLLRDCHIMRFVANIIAGSIRMDHFQAEVFALELPHRLSTLLTVHVMPLAFLSGASWMGFPPLFGFHGNLPTLNSTGLGAVGEHSQSLHRG